MDLLKPLELEKSGNPGHQDPLERRPHQPIPIRLAPRPLPLRFLSRGGEQVRRATDQPGGNLLPVFDPSSEQLASLKPTGQYAYNIAFKGSVRLTALLGSMVGMSTRRSRYLRHRFPPDIMRLRT